MTRFSIQIDFERCKGCELCIDSCPRQVLQISKMINHQGVNYATARDIGRCIGCLNCADICPDSCYTIEKVADAV